MITRKQITLEIPIDNLIKLLKSGTVYRFSSGIGLISSIKDYQKEEQNRIEITHVDHGRIGNVKTHNYWLKAHGLIAWCITTRTTN
jgi:hypothetical protein